MMNKEIFVIRLSSLGDIAMSLHTLISFHLQYPDVKINYITKYQYIPLISSLKFINPVAIDSKNEKISLLNLLKFICNLKLSKNLIIIDLSNTIRSRIMSLGLKFRGVESFRLDKKRSSKKSLVNYTIKELKFLPNRVEDYKKVFEKAGFAFSLSKNKNFYPKVKSDTDKNIKIGIAPFAKHKSKEIPPDILAETIISLNKTNDYTFYILGNGLDEQIIANQYFQHLENTEITIGKLNFEEELKLISSLDIMLSMDSGNGHLASLYDIPTITLWGTTHPCLGYYPYGQAEENWLYPNKALYPFLPVSIYGKCSDKYYSQAIKSIKSIDIVEKIKQILQ